MVVDKVAVIIRNVEDQWEGLRSSLGLGLEVSGPHMFVIGQIQIPEDRAGGYRANLEYLKEELEGRLYTDTMTNVEQWEFFEYMSVGDMAEKLTEYDLIIPF